MRVPKGKHIFGTVKVGEKGQIVIPKAARDVFDIQPGDQLLLLGDEKRGIAIIKGDEMQKMLDRVMPFAQNTEEDE